MVGAVVQLHLEVHDRVARHGAALRRLDDPLLDRRDVAPRDHAADDLVLEHEPRPPGQRRHADPAVAVLASAAGLLLVLALPLGPALEGLPVSDLGLGHQGVHAELAGQPPHDDLEMALPQPANQRLAQLGIVLVVEGGVFL